MKAKIIISINSVPVYSIIVAEKAMKKIFQKAKLEIKFRKAGEGHTLNEDKSNRPSTSHSNAGPTSRSVPSASAQRAGEAALQRFTQQEKTSIKKPQSATATWKHESQSSSSTASGSSLEFNKLKSEVQREIEADKTRYAASSSPVCSLTPVEPQEVDCASKLSVDGIYLKCSLFSVSVLKKDFDNHLKECLEMQYRQNPQVSAATMIHSLNSDKDKVKACIDIICRYIDNVCKNPGEEKFMKIKQSNKIFQERVSPVIGSVEFIASCGFEDKVLEVEGKTEKFYVIPSDKAADHDSLQTYKSILTDTHPVKGKLDRNCKIFKPTSRTMQFELPEDFFSITSDEVKREYQSKLDEIEKNSQLRTKAMRESEKKPTKTYRFTLIRVRFPDETILQGTFYSYEKLQDLFNFVRESLVSDWQPFVLSDPTGQLKNEDSTLNKLGLVPAAVVNFAWDATIMAEIVAATGSVQQENYLKPDMMNSIQELK